MTRPDINMRKLSRLDAELRGPRGRAPASAELVRSHGMSALEAGRVIREMSHSVLIGELKFQRPGLAGFILRGRWTRQRAQWERAVAVLIAHRSLPETPVKSWMQRHLQLAGWIGALVFDHESCRVLLNEDGEPVSGSAQGGEGARASAAA